MKPIRKSPLDKRTGGLKSRKMKFHWVPAGMDSFTKGITLGVRFKPPRLKDDTCFKFSRSGNRTILDLPDRRLYLLRAYRSADTKRFPSDVDMLLNMDLTTDYRNLADAGFRFSMVNTLSIPRVYSTDNYDSEKSSCQIIADSGGFQIATGVRGFLDPTEIIESHNHCCDIGVALDIPITPDIQDKDLTIRLAKNQVNTLKHFLKRKRPSLAIMNVVHGATLEQKRLYRSIVEMPEISHLAIAGNRGIDTLPMIFQVMDVILTGKLYNHYHVLGISGLEKIIVLAYIARHSRAPLITSDSSTHFQLGVSNEYFLPHQLGVAIPLGHNGSLAHPHSILPCSCPLCGIVKYLRVLTTKVDYFVTHMIVYHNLMMRKAMSDVVNDVVCLPKKEILDWAKGSKTNSLQMVHNLSLGIDVIDCILQDGIAAALKRYPGASNHPKVRTSGLFSQSQLTGGSNQSRIVNLVAQYERYFAGLPQKKRGKK